MRRTTFLLWLGIAILTVAARGAEHGETLRISLRSSTPEATIEITDPQVVRQFSIWNGPGVDVNGEPFHLDPERQEGAFVDWPRGQVNKRPGGLLKFEVTLHIGDAKAPNDAARYVFEYEIDVASGQGYVLLPVGRNADLIYHGVEGNWFFASRRWDEVIMPYVVQRP